MLTLEQITDALDRADCNYKQAAILLGVSVSTMGDRIHRLREQGYDIPKPRGHLNRIETFYCPTKAEIERAAAEIRAGWPPGEAAKRAKWCHCGEYEIPRVSMESEPEDGI